jgi:transposase-like protein
MAYAKDTKRRLIEGFDPEATTIPEYAKANDISESTFRKWIRKAENNGTLKTDVEVSDKHPQPNFMKKLDPGFNVMNVLQMLSSRVADHRDEEKDYCKIAVETNKPIAVIKAADLHLGGMDVDYKSLMEHYQFLMEEDRFYLQLFGDDINMMIMHKTTAARHDILTPDEQCNLLVGMVDQLLERGKLLSMCWGNHSDEFTERTAGFSLVKLLLSKKVPYFSGMGYIDLVVGGQTYGQGFTHKTRFNSFMNPLHGSKRMQQMHYEIFGLNRPMCREYITAHTHFPAVALEGCQPEDRIYLIKCGTFKTEDLYSRRYFAKGRIGCPTIVYYPDRVEHIAFPTPYDAYRYMTGKDWPGLKNSERK